MRGKRVIAFLICVAMGLGLLPQVAVAAYTLDIGGSIKVDVVGDRDPKQGYLMTFVEQEGSLVVPFAIQNASNSDITIKTGSYVAMPNNSPFSSIMITGKSSIEGNGRQEYIAYCIFRTDKIKGVGETSFKVYLNDKATGNPLVSLDIPFHYDKTSDAVTTEPTEPTEPTETSSIPEPSASPEPKDEQAPPLLMISPVGEDGTAVTAPAGNGGDSIRVRVPIMNRGTRSFDAIASRIIVTPQISATIDSFPFDVEAIDYSRSLPDMRPGEVKEVVYHFKISKEVKSGVKEIKFNCVYFNHQKQTYETSTLSLFVTVIKGKEEEEGGYKDGDELLVTQPKIIVESSALTPDEPQPDDEPGRLYAGEPFTLTMTLRNTSKEEAINNIQVTLSNEGNIIIPANNASNSFYIDRIEPGQSIERVVKLQSTPDAEPKSQTLKVSFAYESSKTLKGYEGSQDIAVPIAQRVRVRVNDPMIYGDGFVDQEINVSISMMNMSKSTLYYCSIDVEGEGLRMAEPFYYGNVSGGGQMSGDFNIIPSVGGDIAGKVIITFEDAYNKQTRLEKEFSLFVMDYGAGEESFIPGDMGDIMGEMEPPSEGTPLWVLILIGVGVALLGAGLIVMLRRKRRRRELTEML